MRLKFWRKSSPYVWLQAPYNPMSGHDFMCGCRNCERFWNSELGTTLFEAWRRAKAAAIPLPRKRTDAQAYWSPKQVPERSESLQRQE